MSEACAAFLGWARWARAATAAAGRRRCCSNGKGGRRSRRARPACRRRPPRCRARRVNPPHTRRGTTGSSTGTIGRTLTAPVLSRPRRPAALLCRTTPSASCHRSRRPPRCPRRSPASPWSAPATPACPRPPSWPCTRPPGDAPPSPLKIIKGRIIIAFNSSHGIIIITFYIYLLPFYIFFYVYQYTMNDGRHTSFSMAQNLQIKGWS